MHDRMKQEEQVGRRRHRHRHRAAAPPPPHRTSHELLLLGSQLPELIVLVYSALPSEMRRASSTAAARRAQGVVATNIAEASLTIDGIYYVVDPGFVKQKVYNAKVGMDSQGGADLAGVGAPARRPRRADGAGKCYRLYTEAAAKMRCCRRACPRSSAPIWGTPC